MAASSVTGVGCGSVGKASINMTSSSSPPDTRVPLSISNLVGPKIIAAGLENVGKERVDVEFPAPSGNLEEYAVFISGHIQDCKVSDLSPRKGMGKWGFHLSCKEKCMIPWMVIKLGSS